MNICEADTRAKFIDPEIQKSGWGDFVIREHYFTDGRKLLGCKRGKRLFVDYLLNFSKKIGALLNILGLLQKEKQDKLENLKALKESI